MDQATFATEIDLLRQRVYHPVDRDLMGAQALPELVYHYTGSDRVGALLASGCLRGTEARFMNDKTELRHAGLLVQDYLDGDVPRIFGPLGVFAEDPAWLLKPIVGALRENHDASDFPMFFLWCFTRIADSLAQWVRYANNGNGVALGYDLTGLRADDAPALGVDLSAPVVGPCTYDPATQHAAVAATIKPLIDFAIKERPTYIGERVQLIRSTAAHVLTAATSLGAVLKDPGFVEEAEWRIVVLATTREAPPSVKYKANPYGPGLAPYLELPFASGGRFPLKRVVIGPCVDSATEDSIRCALKTHGYSPEIVHSKIPYRA